MTVTHKQMAQVRK